MTALRSIEPASMAQQRQHVQQHTLTLITWNVRNPSLQRARLQAAWLLQLQATILVLTEVKYSQGCLLLREKLAEDGFQVYFPYPMENEYGVMIATKGIATSVVEPEVPFLSSRAVSVLCDMPGGVVKCMGLYVPSRGSKERKNVDKRQFQEQVVDALWKSRSHAGQMMVAGDLNVLERQHRPHYPHVGEWEYTFYESFLRYGLQDAYRKMHPTRDDYSWVGRGGNGYRFDHIFISDHLVASLVDCHYVHTATEAGLSDHAAMCLLLSVPSPHHVV